MEGAYCVSRNGRVDALHETLATNLGSWMKISCRDELVHRFMLCVCLSNRVAYSLLLLNGDNGVVFSWQIGLITYRLGRGGNHYSLFFQHHMLGVLHF